MRIYKIFLIFLFFIFSFESFSQKENESDEDTLVTLYIYVLINGNRSPIADAEVIIFDGNDTTIKYSNNEGLIIHKLDTNLIYHVDVNVVNGLSTFDNFTTKGISSKTNIIREVSVIFEKCRGPLFFIYEDRKQVPLNIDDLIHLSATFKLNTTLSIELQLYSNENSKINSLRINYLKDYLRKEGINEDRLIYRNSLFKIGKGEKSRVEFELVDLYYSLKPSNSVINKYIKYVDSLRVNNSLDKFDLPNMSNCSGTLTGYYIENELVYISSHYSTVKGYSEKEIYIKDSIVYKIRYREHFVKWNVVSEKSNIPKIDASKMEYSDTLYTFVLYNQPKLYKTSGSKFIKTEYDYQLQNRLLDCAVKMTQELKKEKSVK